MRNSTPRDWLGRLLVACAIALAIAACGNAASSAPSAIAVLTPGHTDTVNGAAESSPAEPTAAETGSTASQAPDTGVGTGLGDIPDNAAFLTYRGTSPAFLIEYVEGWQVSQQPDGVVIRDKDSSETVSIVAPQMDVAGYVASTDLPALQALSGFKLVKQDAVEVGGSSYVHLVFHLPAPPDPVTGKRVPSTVDRYYVPGPNGLAIVSLSTPDGVDNVDAFRQMIASFRWS